MEANAAAVIDEESLGPLHLVDIPSSEDHLKSGDDGKTQKTTTLSERLGLEDFSSLEAWRASIAELLGMATLVYAADTIVISSIESDKQTPNLVMSFLFAFILTILLLVTSPISGGHLNPAISLCFALFGHISACRAAIYILAQCIGAMLGALALKVVVNSETQSAFSLGGCSLNFVVPGPDGSTTIGVIATGSALGLEILCMFVVIFAAVGVAFSRSLAHARRPLFVCSIIGSMVGLMMFVSTTVTAMQGYAGAGMNPARCIGPAIVRGGHLWDRHWIFWVGPGIACVVFYVYTKVIPHQHFYKQVQDY